MTDTPKDPARGSSQDAEAAHLASREYEKLARQCAAEGLDHVQFLARLVELELIDRERRMVERRIKAASATGLGPVAASWRTPGYQEPPLS